MSTQREIPANWTWESIDPFTRLSIASFGERVGVGSGDISLELFSRSYDWLVREGFTGNRTWRPSKDCPLGLRGVLLLAKTGIVAALASGSGNVAMYGDRCGLGRVTGPTYAHVAVTNLVAAAGNGVMIDIGDQVLNGLAEQMPPEGIHADLRTLAVTALHRRAHAGQS